MVARVLTAIGANIRAATQAHDRKLPPSTITRAILWRNSVAVCAKIRCRPVGFSIMSPTPCVYSIVAFSSIFSCDLERREWWVSVAACRLACESRPSPERPQRGGALDHLSRTRYAAALDSRGEMSAPFLSPVLDRGWSQIVHAVSSACRGAT